MSKKLPPPPPQHLLETTTSKLPPPPKRTHVPTTKQACLVDDHSLYEQFLHELQHSDSNYEVLQEGDDVNVYKKITDDSSVHRIKAVSKLSVSCTSVLAKTLLWEWDTRKKWDEYIAEAFTIEQVTPHQDYSYFSVVTPYGITSRDYVQYRSFRYFADKHTYHLYYKSIDLNEYPHKEDKIRGETVFSGIQLAPSKQNPEILEITYISQTDFKGYIPTALMNYAAGFAPGTWFKNLNSAVLKYKYLIKPEEHLHW